MKVKVLDLDNGKEVKELSLESEIYGKEIRSDILHKVVAWQRAKKRSGTHKAKGISDISGTTKKPFKQKGTGNARQGSLRSPQFRGGAVIFGPVVRDHSFSIQKKVRALALKMALSSKFSDKKLVVVDDFSIKEAKTSYLNEKLRGMNISSALFVGLNVENHKNFLRAYRNIKNIDALSSDGINVYDILNHEHLILSSASVDTINKKLI